MKYNPKHLMTASFMRRALIVVAISTAIFTIMQYISFLITGNEQSTLIENFFTVVGLECGGCILKKSVDIVTERIRKKENLKKEEEDNEC